MANVELNTEVPVNFGIIVFPGFQALDAFGPLDALNTLAVDHLPPLNLFIIAETLDPVSTKPPNAPNSNFGQSVVPTHTFDTAPQLDVLLIPGGKGTRDPEIIKAAIAFVAKVYPSLRYLITVCTGAGIAACAGVLDGRRATTNKRAWAWTVSLRTQVRWVARARWVVDGYIWTSAGISAGLDVIFAFIAEVYGEGEAERIADILEYERHTDPNWDPYAEKYGLKDTEVS